MSRVALAGLLFVSIFCHAQRERIDSLNRLIAKAVSDTQRVNLTISKIGFWADLNLDSAVALALKTIDEATRLHYKAGEANARVSLAGNYNFKGNYAAAKQNLDIARLIFQETNDSAILAKLYNVYGISYAMQNKFDTAHSFYEKGLVIASRKNDREQLNSLLQNNAISYHQQSNYAQALANYQRALAICEQINDEAGEAFIYMNTAITYTAIDDKARAEENLLKAIALAKKQHLTNVLAYAYSNISSLYESESKFAAQYDFATKAADLARQTGDQGIQASSLARAALALARQGAFEAAEKLGRQSLLVADSSNQSYNRYQAYNGMAVILQLKKDFRGAITHYEKALHLLTDSDLYVEEVGQSYFNLSECYETSGRYAKALSAYKISSQIADSIRGRENIRKTTELALNEEFARKQQAAKLEQDRKDAAAQKAKDGQRLAIVALSVGVAAVIVIALIQFRNNRQKQRTNRLLESQKERVETALTELKSTQAQLVQSEKMASLGELTAGIAHEIQNPLNFVNNFSEVSNELMDEMLEEVEKGGYEEAKLIARDLKQNLQKINHHGKRADGIVKGMLQHSGKSSGQKELTDINALCDEFLRLSYHGLRAKDKSFNADFKMEFDESAGVVNVAPQDIGRVLLNLFTNAFYAVNEKRPSVGGGYRPAVSVGTKKTQDGIEIRVSDNGKGIPPQIIGKIFQPFFTTKPTGLGTGLGLSLSYDIVKAHGGEINVQTKEGEGTTFTICLPLSAL